MAKQRIKVAVTGAAGQIGYSLLFPIASGLVYGPETEIELQLLELEPALPRLNGVAMELEDCAFPLLKNITCTSDVNVAMKDVNWALLVGAAPRKAGMERSDLLEMNGGIFTKQGEAINNNAASDVRALVVGNPCNTNALIAMSNAPDVPNDRFYAMTMLDETRAKNQLALKAGVEVSEVSNMVIWGNHSATQYPDFSHARISGKPATDLIKDEHWLQNDFIKTVQQRGAAVIEARGSSSAASAAFGAIHSVQALVNDTPEGDYFSMCVHSNGEYDIDKGLIFSYPCRVKNGELSVVADLDINEFSKAKIDATHEELRSERDTVKSLGLI